MAWAAPDYIWQAISGYTEKGLLCPICFDALAHSKGVVLAWFVADEPKEDINNVLGKHQLPDRRFSVDVHQNGYVHDSVNEEAAEQVTKDNAK